jgi:hypothetical protein
VRERALQFALLIPLPPYRSSSLLDRKSSLHLTDLDSARTRQSQIKLTYGFFPLDHLLELRIAVNRYRNAVTAINKPSSIPSRGPKIDTMRSLKRVRV